MKRFAIWAITLCLTLAFSGPGNTASQGNSADLSPRMSKEELKTLLGDPSVFILDVRLAQHYRASQSKIKGAVWLEAKEAAQWSGLFFKKQTYVLY
jgi:3-mercaptopyruvate sulfurtransferase SseA